MPQQITFAPLRSLDDFLLVSARFQIPNVQDVDKWGNRVVKNFLYYQTNYFLMGAIVFVLFGMFHPWHTLTGLLVITAIILTFMKYFAGDRIDEQRWIWMGVVIGGGFFTLWMIHAIAFVGLIFLLPFCLAFVHASLRLRNIRNKLSTAIEERLRYTPMGMFLEAMSVTGDKFFSGQ